MSRPSGSPRGSGYSGLRRHSERLANLRRSRVNRSLSTVEEQVPEMGTVRRTFQISTSSQGSPATPRSSEPTQAFDFGGVRSSLPVVSSAPSAGNRASSPIVSVSNRGAFLGEDDVFPRECPGGNAGISVGAFKDTRKEAWSVPFSVGSLKHERLSLGKRPRNDTPVPKMNARETAKLMTRGATAVVVSPLASDSEHEECDYVEECGYICSDGTYRPIREDEKEKFRQAISRPKAYEPPMRENRTSHSVTGGRRGEDSSVVSRSVQKIHIPRFKEGEDFDVFLMKFERYLRRANIGWEDLDEHLLENIQCGKTYKRVRRLKLSDREKHDPERLCSAIRAAIVHRVKDGETERKKLKRMRQAEGESVEEFADRIREVAEFAFPEEADSVVNQRMIETLQDGLWDTRVSEIVCDLRSSDLDFEKVVIAAAKRAKRNRLFRGDIYRDPANRGEEDDSEYVFRVQQDGLPVAQAAQATSLQAASGPLQCNLCGKRGHGPENCWANMKCQLCRETGHIAHQCPRFLGQINQRPQMGRRQQRLGGNSQNRQGGCFECGAFSHRVAQCPTRSGRSVRCFICDEVGHKARDCSQRQRSGNERAAEGIPASFGRE